MNLKIHPIYIALCLLSLTGVAQTTVKVDLMKLSQEKKINTYNRHCGVIKTTDVVIHLDE